VARLEVEAYARIAAAGLMLVSGWACATPVEAPDAAFYRGGTLRIVVGFPAGGTYDVHARLVAGQLAAHLPGAHVVVENMPGAAGAIAARHLAEAAPPDGLTIAVLSETNVADAVDSRVLRRLRFIGSPAASASLILFSRASGIATVDEWRRAPVAPRFAGTGPGAPSVVVPRLLGKAIGVPVRVVAGYGGVAEMRLALETGEVEAICLTMDAYHTAFPSGHDGRVVVRLSEAALPGIDAPDARSLAVDEHARELLDLGVYAMAPLARYFALSVDVPDARRSILQRALHDTWADPAFQAAARAAGLQIAPVTGDALAEVLRSAAAQPRLLAEIRSGVAAP
jgi:tripartite-type tricarboxylate transporter receptor subunit TctC